ncbi:MAG: CotH kinase family protein [Paludibacteraceae bacterium]|nr:CotH kinase family protein [Paludibacteraceae bacterium]
MSTSFSKYLTLFSLLICSNLTINAEVQINEVMPCNLSTIMEKDHYNFSGYIEFSNEGGKDLNLKGYTLVHYKKGSSKYAEKWTWNINTDFTVRANAFTLLWFDETDTRNHAPYKLDTDGGYLLLKKGATLIDSFAYGKQMPHISFGRTPEGTGYMLPSPEAKNTTAYGQLTRCKAPVFSEKGGLKYNLFDLTLNCPTAGATIYYTTDGSEPNTTSTVYDNTPIAIDKNTNIRAIAYAEGMLPSVIETNSYIYEGDRDGCGDITLPVLSITVDNRYFNDKMIGMCVTGKNGVAGEKSCVIGKANYNRDWKRPLNFEYFVDGKQVLSQEVEAAVEGGCSRSNLVKSLSLKASKKTGKEEFDYHFFNCKPDLIHQTVHMRNGGTASTRVKFRDGLMLTLSHPMNIDYQAYQPIAYYINGKYTGLQALMERTNADYIKANYGLDEDEIDLIALSDQMGITATKGTLDSYNELVKFLETEDSKTEAFYDGACRRIDMDEYIDYQVFEQFVANIDWPGNNTKIWRERKTGSRFRWIAFDTDYGFGVPGISSAATSDRDFILWCRGEGKTSWANEKPWMVTIFKHLSNNPQFNKKFATKYLIHLNSTFSEERLNAVIDSVTAVIKNEYCVDIQRSSKEDAESMRKFAMERRSFVLKHLQEFMKTKEAVDFELKSNVEGAHFTINKETVEGFKGKYLAGFDSEFRAYPPVGYKFDHWEIEGGFDTDTLIEDCTLNLPGVLGGSLKETCTITAIFTKSNDINTLVINEMCASSNEKSGNADAYGKYPDWIEVYNFGDETVDLAGCYFSNKKSELLLSQIAYGSDETQVKSKEHKIIWANSNPVDGALYLNFNMNVDKPKTIYLSDAAGNIISEGAYDLHNTNESYGYSKDNAKDWGLFSICEGNITATPGKENGTVECDGIDTEIITSAPEVVALYPNPAIHTVEVAASTPMQEVGIYDLNGRLLMQYRPNSAKHTIDISNLCNGVYVVKVNCEDGVYNKKLVKQ